MCARAVWPVLVPNNGPNIGPAIHAAHTPNNHKVGSLRLFNAETRVALAKTVYNDSTYPAVAYFTLNAF